MAAKDEVCGIFGIFFKPFGPVAQQDLKTVVAGVENVFEPYPENFVPLADFIAEFSDVNVIPYAANRDVAAVDKNFLRLVFQSVDADAFKKRPEISNVQGAVPFVVALDIIDGADVCRLPDEAFGVVDFFRLSRNQVAGEHDDIGIERFDFFDQPALIFAKPFVVQVGDVNDPEAVEIRGHFFARIIKRGCLNTVVVKNDERTHGQNNAKQCREYFGFSFQQYHLRPPYSNTFQGFYQYYPFTSKKISEKTKKHLHIRRIDIIIYIRQDKLKGITNMYFAQMLLDTAADSSATAMGGRWSTMLLLAAMVGVMYFIIIRPQKKKQKEEQALRDNIQIGDEVTTIGGIVGKVVTVKEDTVVIETGADRVKLKFLKGAIQTNNTANEKLQEQREAARKAAEEARAQKKSKKAKDLPEE